MDDKPQVSHRQSVGALKPFWSATFGEEPKEDPFESLYQQPRAKSSQAQFGDSTNMNTGTLCSGSSSAPVTGLVGTVHQDPEGHSSLDKLTSLPTSSSSSLIERPPLSPVLPLPTNSLTNATMTSNQYLPYVHSFPHLPTNAAEDLMPFQGSSVPQFSTNAETQSPAEPSDHTGGLTMKERPASPPVPNSQPRTEEMSTTEKEYLLQSKDWRHMRGVGLLEGEQSLSSSLNQSMSSLLDSQEDVAQQSPVTILPPAPEATPQPPSTTPQPSQQFPTSKQAGNLAQDQARQPEGNETESERTTPMLTNAAPGIQHFLPPLHNSFLPSGVSSLPHTVSVSQPPPLHTSPHLVSSENPMYSVAPTNYLNTTSETPPQVEVPREEFPGSVPLVSSAPPLQVPVASSASRPPVQPSFQPPPAQPQPLLQQPNMSSVLPPPSLPTSQATVLPQGGVQPAQVSSVLPPPSEIYASPFQSHLPASQERTNADTLQPTFQDGAPLSVQPPPSQQSELQYPVASLQPPQPLDVGHNPTEHNRGEGGPVLNAAPPDSSQVQTAQQVSAPPPPSLLPPPTQDPLSNAPSNAGLLLSQQSIPSNAHPLSQQPPLQSVPSNAQQPLPEAVPGVLSNAHPPPTEASMGVHGTQPNIYQPTSEANAQGVLSNAYPAQSLPRSLVTGVHPPPATTSHHAPSDNVGTQPQHLSSIANTAGIVTPALSNKPPHPLNVPLHQQPIKGNLLSTPDSVFSHPTTEAPQVTSNVVTGLSTAASALPANPYHQTGPVFSTVAPKVHLTQTQAALQTQPNVGPVTVTTSLPQATSFPQLTANAQPLGVSETPQVISGLVHTSGAGVGKANMPSVPSLPPQPTPISVTNTSHEQPSLVAASSSVAVSGPPRPAVTAPVPPQEQRASAVDHRHPGGQRHSHSSVSHQPPLSSSSSGVPPSSSHHQPHHGTAEHPMHHPHPGYRGRGDGRPWRHTTDLRQRERYDPYYDEDPYEYERHGHYYEDPYYRDYYRPRPGSRAPHMYYPDPYEHDPYGSYYTEYDPYTGKYYYVEDPYVYQSDYDAYNRGYYGHPREVVPGHSQHMMQQGDPHRHTREHTQEQPINHDPAAPGAPYPDQSTIDGPGGVFEEGGTFYASPDARGGHGAQPYHPERGNLHHLYPESSRYGTEPPVQPDWGPSEPSVESQPPEPPIVVRNTPEKFACPHVRASFAPGGTLVVVLPHNLRAFQRAEVELSHVTELVSDSVHSNFVRAVSEFPGPLMPGETPKSVAISYATRQAEQCRTKKQAGEENEEDEVVLKELDDETLLWEFLVLLCQQNGVVVANDISELLTREKSTVIPTRTHVGTGDQEDALENIRQLLISGRKRDALELACSRCLWGHALMLASRMDEQSRTYVINRFTASLVTTDPLSTFYTLMLGRTPSAVKPEGLRRAGSWRPHLAMILANRTSRLDNTSIVTLGDSLLESGRLCAAHFCYHLADIPFGPYGSTTSKYLLLGTGSSELAMGAFPHPEHLRKMEVFEYAMSLGKMEYVLPHFQVFKFLLALQLTQFGMVAMAFKYCEQIAAFIGKSPGKFPSTLLHVLDELSTQLHHLNHPHGVVETELPSWLLQLQQISTDVMTGNYNSSARSTPSPTFSSVSQAYGQGRHNAFMGQARSQYLKVPGSSYKASSVDSSTATSSKEGSVVGGGLPPMPPVAQQDSYQPSNLLVSQQPGLELVQGEGHDQPDSQSIQQPPASEEIVPVVSGAEGTTTYYTTQGQVPYGDTYSATAGPSSSEGGMNYGISQAPPSSEQYPAPVGVSGEFGVTTTAVGNVEPQPAPSYDQPMYGQASDVQPQPWRNYPVMEGQHYQGGQEQPPQFGYGQPAVDVTQSGMFQPNLQPPSQPGYGGGAMWDQQYTGQAPAETIFSGSGGAGDRNTPATAGDINREEREARKEEEEKEENKDGESKKDGE